MKKPLFVLSSLFFLIVISAQAQFEVKEYAAADKHKRSIVLSHSIAINSISVAKEANMTVEDFATKMGDNWATTWNKEAGFKGFINGSLWNNSCFINDDQPKIEIIDQSETMCKIKVYKSWKPLFANGPVFNVTEQELNTFWNIAGQRIADYMGAEQKMEDAGDFVIYTINKK